MDLSKLLSIKHLRIKACEKSLFLFGLFYFRHYFTVKSADFHKALTILLMFNGHSHLLIIGFRESAKTVWAKIKIVHNIVYKKKMFNIYCCFDKAKAKSHVYDIAIELQTNNHLIEDFGQLFFDDSFEKEKKSRKKSIDEFITETGIKVMAVSVSVSVRGLVHGPYRPDFWVIDDFENVKTYRSAKHTATVIEFFEELFGGMSGDANIVFLANRITLTGSVSHIEGIARARKDVVLYEIKIEENGKLTWESRFCWTDEEADEYNRNLTNKKKYKISLESRKGLLGTNKFLREYYNQPTSEETQVIKERWITENYYDQAPTQMVRAVMIVDPSAGLTENSDECAIGVVSWVKNDSHRYVLESEGWRGKKLTDRAAYVIAYWLKYRTILQMVGIEKVLNQTALYDIIVDWKNGNNVIPKFEHIKDRNIPVVAIDPKGRTKAERVSQQEAKFERGEVHLRPHMTMLKDQLIAFPNTLNDDRLDTIIYALEESHITDHNVTVSKNEQNTTTHIGNVRKKVF